MSGLETLLASTFEGTEEPALFLNLAVGAFAFLLLALSLNAYRKTRLRRLLFVSAAFGLFSVQVVLRHLEIYVLTPGFDADLVIATGLDFVILLLFFLAIVVKD